MIRVLHINYQTENSSACNRIIECQLNDKRIIPSLLTLRNSTQISHIPMPGIYKLYFLFRVFLNKVLHIIKKKKKYFFSYNTLSVKYLKIFDFNQYDVIHFHWVGHGSIDYEIIQGLSPKIVKKKVYVHFHDVYAITGGCHIPYECQGYKNSCVSCKNTFFPSLVSKNFKRKIEVFKELNPIAIYPTNTLKKYCQNASLLRFFKKEVVIPNPLDIQFDHDKNKNHNKKLTILMIANNLNDPNKRLLEVINMLENIELKLQKGIKLVLMGNIRKKPKTFIEIEYNPFSSDINDIKSIYKKSDFTIVASKFETFSQVALESISNGVPVITFENLGAADFIFNSVNGIVIPDSRFDSMAEKILIYAKDYSKVQTLKKGCNPLTMKPFNYESISKTYYNEYKE